MFTHSIRWRWQLWLGFLLLTVLTGFGIAVYQLQRVNQLNQIDEDLGRRLASLSAAVRGGPPFGPGAGRPPPGRLPFQEFEGGPRRSAPPRDRAEPSLRGGSPNMRPGPREPRPRELRLSPEVARLFEEDRTNAVYYAVWDRTGTLLKQSANAPAALPRPERFGRDTQTHFRMRGVFREAFHFTELGDGVLAGRSMIGELNARRRFAWVLLAAGTTVLAFGLGVGWWLTTRAIRPVEEISAAARRISAGHLSERIRVADPENELGRLAGVLNSTFARLDAAFAQQKQFTADASHELRTPLAVIVSEAQTTLARERTAAEYRDTVETCLEAAQQMRRLTESLLELARLDSGQDPFERRPLDLADTTRACVDLIRPLAARRGLELHCELAPAGTAGDPNGLHQVVTNLLANAIHYNRPAGEIRVSTRLENGHALLTVADTGPGIAAEDLPHIFERFYRADKSRARADGRSGLGLAICKAIVEAHGGSIEVASPPGNGAVFAVRLPARTPEPWPT